eukprot:scaffold1610_cov257-Pinguiococcus_pyrenoidosus.AAC.64
MTGLQRRKDLQHPAPRGRQLLPSSLVTASAKALLLAWKDARCGRACHRLFLCTGRGQQLAKQHVARPLQAPRPAPSTEKPGFYLGPGPQGPQRPAGTPGGQQRHRESYW